MVDLSNNKLCFKYSYDHIRVEDLPTTYEKLQALLKEIDKSEAYMLKHFSPKRHKIIKDKSEDARHYFRFIYSLYLKEE